MVKNLPANTGDTGSISGLERNSGEKMATLSGILAWKVTWTVEPGGLQSIGLPRIRHD